MQTKFRVVVKTFVMVPVQTVVEFTSDEVGFDEEDAEIEAKCQAMHDPKTKWVPVHTDPLASENVLVDQREIQATEVTKT